MTGAENQLFDTMVRKFTGKRSWNESEFSYENRSARPEMGTLRKALDSWYTRFPDDDKDLRARFRKKDDYTHRSALFELYCHEILGRCGYSVEVHPKLHGRPEHPDFLTYDAETRKNKIAYLECRMVLEPPDLRKADRIKRDLYAHLDERFGLTGVSFFIDVKAPKERERQVTQYIAGVNGSIEERTHSIAVAPLQTPNLNQIRKYFERELSGITPDKSRAQLDRGWASAEIHGIFGDWQVTVVPLPIDRELGNGPIAMRSFPLVQQPEELIKSALDDKAAKYSDFEVPYVIALNTSDPLWMQPTIVKRSLYGNPGEQGWFHSSRYGQRVSAVAVARGLYSWNIAANDFELWHNPFAAHPLGSDFWPDTQHFFDPSSGETSVLEGRDMHKLLGLPADLGLDAYRLVPGAD